MTTADSMHALRWHGRRDLRLEAVPIPTPQPGQVLIAVERVGICGTDIEEYVDGPVAIPTTKSSRSGVVAPLTLGHEIVGVVVKAPGGEWQPGTRVVPDVVVGCGNCWWCHRHQEGLCPELTVLGLQDHGGLANYMLADARTCVEVPPVLTPEIAAFAEPLAVATRAIAKVPSIGDKSVAVVGAGVIGNLVLQVARNEGSPILAGVDPKPGRRQMARDQGASVFHPDQLSDLLALTDFRGFDVVVECAGSQEAVRFASDIVRSGGDLVLVGTGPDDLLMPVRRLIHAEVRVSGSAAHLWDVDVAKAVELLTFGQVNVAPLLSKVVKLSQSQGEAFEVLARGADLMKVQIDCRLEV